MNNSNILAGNFFNFSVDWIKIEINLSFVVFINLRKREGANEGKNDECHAVEPGAHVGEEPENNEVLCEENMQKKIVKTEMRSKFCLLTLIETTRSSTSKTAFILLTKQVTCESNWSTISWVRSFDGLNSKSRYSLLKEAKM